MVVVNLYLFVEIVVKVGCILVDVVENIDIGGLIMVCFVVKNYKDVIIVVNVYDYDCVIVEMDVNDKFFILEICFDFVIVVFEYIVVYDGMIVNYFGIMVFFYGVFLFDDEGKKVDEESKFFCIFN